MSSIQEIENNLKQEIGRLSECLSDNQCLSDGSCPDGHNPTSCYSDLEGHRTSLLSIQAALADQSCGTGTTGEASLRDSKSIR